MTDIENISNANSDPFSNAGKEGNDNGTGDHQQSLIHIRIQQRNGRKTLTTVQGISLKFDLKKIAKYCKKKFSCNGTVVEHPEYGEIIQLTGDQRKNVHDFLLESGFARQSLLKVHGF